MKKIVLSILCIWICACNESNQTTEHVPPFPSPSPALVAFSSCNEVLTTLQNREIRRMEAVFQNWNPCDVIRPMAAADTEQIRFTPTNIQETDADEADKILTNGNNLFVLKNNTIEAFTLWPVTDFRKIATFTLPLRTGEDIFMHNQAFLYRNTLIILADQNISQNQRVLSETHMISVDVSDPSHPRMTEHRIFHGHLQDSRRINERLHVTINLGLKNIDWEMPTSSQTFPFEALYGTCSNEDSKERFLQEQRSQQAARLEQNRQRILQTRWEDWFDDLSEYNLESCSQLTSAIDDSLDTTSILQITSIDFTGQQNLKTTSLLTSSSFLYASSKSLFIASTSWNMNRTGVHYFDLTAANSLHQYKGSQYVPGHVLNSFSMGEFDHTFRIATTQGAFGTASNGLYVLDLTQATLPIMGSIGNIAPGEAIYAVRYVGEKAYVVTAVQFQDPLFIINLKNPRSPTLEGSLEIPGFSTYLHPIGENHVLGVGLERMGMPKISLFDVSNSKHPVEQDREILENSFSSSLWNPHAFTFDTTHDLLVLPLYTFLAADTSNSHIAIYRVTENGGIEPLRTIPLPDATEPQRSFFIESNGMTLLYVVSDGKVFQMEGSGEFRVLRQESL